MQESLSVNHSGFRLYFIRLDKFLVPVTRSQLALNQLDARRDQFT